MTLSANEEEQRRFSRVPFVQQVTLSQGDINWQGTVVDICFNGILINGKDLPIIGANNTDEEALAMTADSVIHFDNGIDINANLELAHQHGDFYGFRFSEIDTDSLMHLRNIISLNLGDDNACRRELMNLFSYHQ